MNVAADSINVLALYMGKIAVEVDGVEIDELIDVVNDKGYTLHIATTPGEIVAEAPLPPTSRISGIQCSTAHITDEDNSLRMNFLSNIIIMVAQNWCITQAPAI